MLSSGRSAWGRGSFRLGRVFTFDVCQRNCRDWVEPETGLYG